jgi:hypothetical protein
MADNSSRKFKFISPGVFVNEIDNSGLPATPADVGPVIIGRAQRGPAFEPTRVESFSDFIGTFGNPLAGGAVQDAWRQGDVSAPMYGTFAAQAYLANNAPITYVRVLGDQDTNASTTNGKAGWEVNKADSDNTKGGAWAIVVFPSASGMIGTDPAITPAVTGAVAAQIYLTGGRFALSGAFADPTILSDVTSSCNLVQVTSEINSKLRSLISTAATPTVQKAVDADISYTSSDYIRTVLNTNPVITNSEITDTVVQAATQGGEYWVGETFSEFMNAASDDSLGVLGADLGTSYYAIALPMVQTDTPTTIQQNDFKFAARKASTGWFIGQDLNTDNTQYNILNQQKLFRIEALTAGEAVQKEVKVSIANIRAAQGDYQSYGSFSVLIRQLGDDDNRPVIIERFDNLNLNPASPDYIGIRIGDRYKQYDSVQKRNVEYGSYDNQSNYIKVCMDENVERGITDSRYLPFGVYGPLKYRDVSYGIGGADTSSGFQPIGYDGSGTGYSASLDTTTVTMLGGGNQTIYGEPGGHTGGAALKDVPIFLGAAGNFGFTGSINFPAVPLRVKSTWGGPKSLQNTYWGAWTGRTTADSFLNPSMVDLLRARASGLGSVPYSTTHDIEGPGNYTSLTGSDPLTISWAFSLDNVAPISGAANGNITHYKYVSGSRAIAKGTLNSSYTAASGTAQALKDGLDRFTTVLAGGTDGFNITERDPFRESAASFSGKSNEVESYQLYSLRKAINLISEQEDVQMNAVVMPGITQQFATQYLLDTVEDRGDSLAVIDVPYAYTPNTESSGSAQSRNSGNTPQAAVDNLLGRPINTSYGATYYPWVRIQDTITNQTLWAPPSIAALGVYSTTDRTTAPWFAPAGFTRGGLSDGAAGIPVLDVSQKLTSDDRDLLYESGINPIAKFPAEGIVVFGQKTLQQTASALDRINVRRLMIFLKREISFMASRLLFGPNTQVTWDRFTSQAEPLLESVRSRFGIEEFRLILDESTTTPDLIDRNIIYAKLLVKPTRAVEYFAIDFVVTNSGAAFDD